MAGTNGKTSITTILNEILTLNKNKVGLIGTIKILMEKRHCFQLTTPESIDYNIILIICWIMDVTTV